MSEVASSFEPDSQGTQRNPKVPIAPGYVFNEEEKRVIQECNYESFFYRSLPLSALAFAVTRVMLTRGIITPSARFGSSPKYLFACIIGYMGGKISYLKTCTEKLEKLENSPLAEALRRKALPKLNQSEFADPNQADPQPSRFEGAFQHAEAFQPNPYSSNSSGDTHSSHSSSYEPVSFSSGQSEPAALRDDVTPQDQLYQTEDTPKKRTVMYKDLRNKNRENYEVTFTQKAKSLLKPQGEEQMKEGKTNKYGDAWEE